MASRAPQLSVLRMSLVGSGTLQPVVEALVRDFPGRVSWTERLSQREISAALDDVDVPLLPSRSEGMGRVIVEAFCRARAVVASRVGGIPDLLEDGMNGLLVEPGDTDGLAGAIVRLASDRALAERLGAGAHVSAALWTISPEDFAGRLRAMVERITGVGGDY